MFAWVVPDRPVQLGPDAQTYLLAAGGEPVVRPFHLRWFLPWLCGRDAEAWWLVWWLSWPIAAAGFAMWRFYAGDPVELIVAGVVVLLALPGVVGPQVTIPVGVDLPAMAVSLLGVGCLQAGVWPAALACFVLAASMKETMPVWAALWVWSPVPLLALLAPAIRFLLVKPAAVSQVGAEMTFVAQHPVRSAWLAHRGRWRDGWLMVAPWGVGVLALVNLDWRLAVLLVVAYAQLLVATDTVRLVQVAAGPAVAVAAVQVIPVEWMVLALVAHVVWWRQMERV